MRDKGLYLARVWHRQVVAEASKSWTRRAPSEVKDVQITLGPAPPRSQIVCKDPDTLAR